MATTDVRAALMSVPTIRAALEDALDSLTLMQQALEAALAEPTSAGVADLGQLVATATGTVEQPEAWPTSGTWDAKIQWVEAQAGVKSTGLPTVGQGGFIPAGCRWVANGSTWNLYVDTATVLEDMVVPGTIVPRGTSGPDITLRNVVAQDCFTWEKPRIKVVEDCTFTIPAARVTGGWGQGCLNALTGGFAVRRTLLTGGADGIQCSGGGLIEDSVIRDLTIGPTTHNDFIQNYGGTVTITRCVMRQQLDADESNHVNGLFCDGGVYVVNDSAITVTAPAGVNGFAIHAAKAGHVEISNSLVRGTVIGDVRIGANVERV